MDHRPWGFTVSLAATATATATAAAPAPAATTTLRVGLQRVDWQGDPSDRTLAPAPCGSPHECAALRIW